MTEKDLLKLIGGYATNTLTDEERRVLFEAALTKQEVFDALANEQALKDLLDDPANRRQLLESLPEYRAPAGRGVRNWFWRPAPLALAGAVSAAVVIVAVVRELPKTPSPPEVKTVAMAPPVAALPAPAAPSLADKTAPVKEAKLQPAEKKKETKTVPAVQPTVEIAMRRQAADSAETLTLAESKPSAASRRATRTQQPAPKILERQRLTTGAVAGYVAPVEVRSPPLTCRILQVGADGTYNEVDRDAVFHAGDSVRLAVEPSESGYLAVAEPGSTPPGKRLFLGEVQAGTQYLIPRKSAIRFEDQPGDLRLLIIFSHTPIDWPKNEVDVRSLIAEKPGVAGVKVGTGSRGGGQMSVEVVLKHR